MSDMEECSASKSFVWLNAGFANNAAVAFTVQLQQTFAPLSALQVRRSSSHMPRPFADAVQCAWFMLAAAENSSGINFS
jgi:hypothetical protein